MRRDTKPDYFVVRRQMPGGGVVAPLDQDAVCVPLYTWQATIRAEREAHAALRVAAAGWRL